MKSLTLALLLGSASAFPCFDEDLLAGTGAYMLTMQLKDADSDAEKLEVAKYDTEAKAKSEADAATTQLTGIKANIATMKKTLEDAGTVPTTNADYNTAANGLPMLQMMTDGKVWYHANYATADKPALAAKAVGDAIAACKADTKPVVLVAEHQPIFKMLITYSQFQAEAKAMSEAMDKWSKAYKLKEAYAGKSDPDKATWDAKMKTDITDVSAAYVKTIEANFPDTWDGALNAATVVLPYAADETTKCFSETGVDAACIKAGRASLDAALAEMKTAKDMAKTTAEFKKALDAKKAAGIAAALDALKPKAGAAGFDCKKAGEGADAKRPDCGDLCCGDLVAKPADGAEADYTNQMEICGAKDATEAYNIKTAATATINGSFETTVVPAVTEKYAFRCIEGAKSLAASAAALAAATYIMA